MQWGVVNHNVFQPCFGISSDLFDKVSIQMTMHLQRRVGWSSHTTSFVYWLTSSSNMFRIIVILLTKETQSTSRISIGFDQLSSQFVRSGRLLVRVSQANYDAFRPCLRVSSDGYDFVIFGVSVIYENTTNTQYDSNTFSYIFISIIPRKMKERLKTSRKFSKMAITQFQRSISANSFRLLLV
jgi:hypothetical protein